MSMSKNKCCVPGCIESGRSHKTLHHFPNPAKDRERFNKWVFSIGGDIIGLQNDHIYKLRRVCHAHFEEKFCCRYDRLSNIAVPTLHLPGFLSLPKFAFEERRPMREIQNCPMSPLVAVPSPPFIYSEPQTLALMEENLDLVVKQPTSERPLSASNRPSLVLASTSASLALPTKEPQRDEHFEENIECHKVGTVRKTAKKHVRVTPTEQKLYKKLLQTRIKLSKCRSTIKKHSASLKAARNITTNPALLTTIEKLPSAAKIITMMQFRQAKKKDKGRRFSLQEKILALSIFKQAPKGYRFLRKILILPAPQTLAKLITKADIKPGVNEKIFTQLKNATNKMKEAQKLCVLLFDEIFLKASVNLNERRDRVIGFATDGHTTKPEFADHAQVYMIRGLTNNYKQPVSYSFAAAATSGQQIATQIKEIVARLQEAGLIVIATICDQGANNRLAIKLLLQETRGIYLRKGQEPRENVILINDKEITPLYDPPHLLKCIRNNLLTKNLEYTSNNRKCIAKWDHLILLHKKNPGYKGVRLIPKLTENHVLPEKVARNKMKVKFASQIFSRTVATNMGYLADKGILPAECKDTADCLIFFDNLFDSLNGSFSKKEKKFGKPLLGPVTPKSAHHKEWAEAKKKLTNMKFVNQAGVVENVPTLKNWAWTLDGCQFLLEKLEKEYGVTSVWMRHLNQDPLENFFGAIRSHGCRNTNPTPEQFEGAFTTLLINNLSSVHAPTGGNCEEDFAKNLHALIISEDCTATPAAERKTDIGGINITIEDINTKNDPRIMAPLQYITGYFVKKAKTKVFKSCEKCTKNLIATEGVEYIKYREYAGRQWLCSPTISILNCISEIQDINNTIIKECLEKDNIKELIKTYILFLEDFDFLECEEHKDNLISYLINLTSRFFLHNYCKDINKILSGKRECYDDEDKFQIKAKKYHKKCMKRPRK